MPMQPDNPKFEQPDIDPAQLYDDMSPLEPPRLSPVSSFLVSMLLDELNRTLTDVTKVLAFLEQLERSTAPRPTVSGETLPSSFAEGFLQAVKRSGVEKSVREQLTKLQGAAFKANLEINLRLYLEALRQRGDQLRATITPKAKSAVNTVKPEQYQAENDVPIEVQTQAKAEPKPAPTGNRPRPVDVAPAQVPSRELVVDVFDEPTLGEVVLVAEHPGLLANSVRVLPEHDIVTINVADINGQHYSKECLLPVPVEPDNIIQLYRNGVLEIRLKRQK